jgi:large repetitive protein
MNSSFVWNALRAGALLCPAFLVFTTMAQPAKPAIWLDPSERASATSEPLRKGEATFANAPANFHVFPSARLGEDTYPERLILHFGASVKLTKIESSRDFQVEQSSSCAEGRFYSKGESCILFVRFTPQGPGRRLGKITITHTGSAEPFAIGLGGNGYAPVISFNPAVITTVPGTYPSSKGLLSGAQNLTVDGSDALYIADTGNNAIWYMDSSGKFTNLTASDTISSPFGIAVDSFGQVYFSEPSASAMYEIWDYGLLVHINGTGNTTCTVSSPCALSSEGVYYPGQVSMDPNNNLFFEEGKRGAAMSAVLPTPNFAELFDPFTYQELPYGSDAFTIDVYDNLYSNWADGYECMIIKQTLSNAENSVQNYQKVGGGRTCGFSGDGGQFGNAEIGKVIGQMAWDIAGNLYLTDTSNQRVRRVDAVTGIINTIAGNGIAGYAGDGGQANQAELSSPSGVTVDSQGQVYIISGTAATGTAQVVRKLGPNGFLNFGGQLKGTASAAHLVTVANTGNSALTLTNVVITGGNASEFAIDPTTTSCLLTPGSYLYSGQSCKVGVLFKPAAAGGRAANLVLLDNAVTNSNTVQLSGAGLLPAPAFTITSPATGTSVAAGKAITFSVSVTSTTSPAPTGKVTMLLDGAAISGSPVTLNSSGVASLSVVTSIGGSHTLATAYSGDANYAAAGSITRTYTVTAAASKPATVKLSSKPNPAQRCKPVTFSIVVSGSSGEEPTGKVELKKGATMLAVADLKNGKATLTTWALTVGANLLTASYLGDSKNGAATSTVLQEMVSPGLCNIIEPVRDPWERAAFSH